MAVAAHAVNRLMHGKLPRRLGLTYVPRRLGLTYDGSAVAALSDTEDNKFPAQGAQDQGGPHTPWCGGGAHGLWEECILCGHAVYSHGRGSCPAGVPFYTDDMVEWIQEYRAGPSLMHIMSCVVPLHPASCVLSLVLDAYDGTGHDCHGPLMALDTTAMDPSWHWTWLPSCVPVSCFLCWTPTTCIIYTAVFVTFVSFSLPSAELSVSMTYGDRLPSCVPVSP